MEEEGEVWTLREARSIASPLPGRPRIVDVIWEPLHGNYVLLTQTKHVLTLERLASAATRAQPPCRVVLPGRAMLRARHRLVSVSMDTVILNYAVDEAQEAESSVWPPPPFKHNKLVTWRLESVDLASQHVTLLAEHRATAGHHSICCDARYYYLLDVPTTLTGTAIAELTIIARDTLATHRCVIRSPERRQATIAAVVCVFEGVLWCTGAGTDKRMFAVPLPDEQAFTATTDDAEPMELVATPGGPFPLKSYCAFGRVAQCEATGLNSSLFVGEIRSLYDELSHNTNCLQLHDLHRPEHVTLARWMPPVACQDVLALCWRPPGVVCALWQATTTHAVTCTELWVQRVTWRQARDGGLLPREVRGTLRALVLLRLMPGATAIVGYQSAGVSDSKESGGAGALGAGAESAGAALGTWETLPLEVFEHVIECWWQGITTDCFVPDLSLDSALETNFNVLGFVRV